VTSDTAGGVWTESAGSWLHLNGRGETERRFNDLESMLAVRGLAAESPTSLIVSRSHRGNPLSPQSGLFRFDSTAATWVKIDGSVEGGPDAPSSSNSTGDVAVSSDGRIVFVDFFDEYLPETFSDSFAGVVARPYAVRAIDATGEVSTVLEPDPESLISGADEVDVDVDATGTIYVATTTRTFAVRPDGTIVPLSGYPQRTPILAVNPAGDVLMSTAARGEVSGQGGGQGGVNGDVSGDGGVRDATGEGGVGDIGWSVVGGSREARDVIADYGDCEGSAFGSYGTASVSVLTAGRPPERATPLPFSCGAANVAWLDGNEFLLAIGNESGTILGRVTPPSEP
jgi:hypothetical protein